MCEKEKSFRGLQMCSSWGRTSLCTSTLFRYHRMFTWKSESHQRSHAQNGLFIRRINDTTVKTRSMKSETSWKTFYGPTKTQITDIVELYKRGSEPAPCSGWDPHSENDCSFMTHMASDWWLDLWTPEKDKVKWPGLRLGKDPSPFKSPNRWLC